MKIKLFGAIAMLAMSVPAFCAAASIHFEGGTQRDHGKPATFDLAVAAGETSRMALLNQTIVEFATPGSEHPDNTVIRLYDAQGKLLHTDTIPGKDLTRASFRYLICGDKVSFVSPAPKGSLACPKG